MPDQTGEHEPYAAGWKEPVAVQNVSLGTVTGTVTHRHAREIRLEEHENQSNTFSTARYGKTSPELVDVWVGRRRESFNVRVDLAAPVRGTRTTIAGTRQPPANGIELLVPRDLWLFARAYGSKTILGDGGDDLHNP